MIFLITRGVVGGRRVGALSAIGIESATSVYVLATAFGLTAVLAASALALSTIRYVGAAYLLYLGIRTIMSRRQPLVPAAGAGAAPISAWKSWREGFFVGISNPKVALFFLAFFPQFVHPEAGPVIGQVLILGAIFVSIGIVLDVTYGVAGGALGALLVRSGAAVRRSRLTAGLSYLALGGYTAVGGQGKA
jgi:threonine/homoserine/homoserine lactone efflux protein